VDNRISRYYLVAIVGGLFKTALDKVLTFPRQGFYRRVMRATLLHITKGHSTKSERRFTELLKAAHIKFRYKVMIGGREVDFLIGKFAIEIDAHTQDVSKNHMLISEGYHPVHLHNWEITERLTEWLKGLH